MKKLLVRYDKQLLLFLLLIVASVYSFIAISTHNHFLTFGWDLGFFDQLIWKVSRFIYPFSSLNKVNILANHFSPVLFFFAPLYWLWSDVRVLLIAQAFLVVFAAYPLYWLSFSKTKNRVFSLMVVFSFLFFLGTQWSILNEFHELTAAPMFIVLLFYGLEKKNKLSFWLGIIGLLMVKEEMALLVFAFGLTAAFFFRKKKLGILLALLSFLFFLFLLFIFMPTISEKGTYQHSHLSKVARTPIEFTKKLFTDPYFAVSNLISPPEKIKTLTISFLSFGLIPLFAPFPILIPVIEQFLMRFLYAGGQFTTWLNVNHHAAPLAMLLPISSIYAAYLLINRYRRNKKEVLAVLSLTLFFSTVMQDIILKAPIHSLIKRQFYETHPWMMDNRVILTEIRKLSPKGAIAVQNSLYPHLSQRENIYLLPEIADAEYLAVDFHNGPNKYAPYQYEQMVNFVNNLIAENKFSIIKQQGEAIILQKK